MGFFRERRTRLFYFPEVEARLNQPVTSENGLQSLSRFVRSYYVRGRDEKDALSLLARDIAEEGAELISADGLQVCPDNNVPSELRGKLLKRWGRGVCWRSGRAFYQVD